MPTNTYVALDKVTLATATPSVTFSSIPATYTDLVIVSNNSRTSNSNMLLRVGNGSVDTGFNYSYTFMAGDGSAFSGRAAGTNATETSYQFANTWGQSIINLQNYANTTTNKTFLTRAGQGGWGTIAYVGLWRSTSAINTIELYSSAGNFAVGSTFSLYGIKAWAAETTPKATGGYVYEDSTYYYHSFPFSGTFTPNQSLTCDYLVIGGGGSGGSGGGAGAYRTSLEASPLSLTAQAYTVTVGAGGVSEATTGGTFGTNGNDTIFSTITSNGGGRGGQIGTTSSNGNGAANGNASGGGAGSGGPANSGGAGGAYGNAGGESHTSYPSPPAYGSGGGGGAGSAGGRGSTAKGGDGGAGKNVNATWATVTGTGVNGYYAGGGAGYAEPGYAQLAVGGSGGGGSATSPNGVVSTGSGAASISNLNNYKGGNGGSGLVIIRYAK